jgi:hypothetical protein
VSKGTARSGSRLAGVRSIAVATILLGLLLGSCAGTAPSSSEAPFPAVSTARDGRFQLQLQAPRATYRPADAIEAVAFVTYLGPTARDDVFHGGSLVGFRIAEIGGRRTMGGGMDMPCLQTPMNVGEPVAFEFQKSGAIAEDPAEGFDRAWYEEPVLRLPPGRWQIVAHLLAYFDECGGEEHQLETSIEVVVAP